jgi:hypothetical protein
MAGVSLEGTKVTGLGSDRHAVYVDPGVQPGPPSRSHTDDDPQ